MCNIWQWLEKVTERIQIKRAKNKIKHKAKIYTKLLSTGMLITFWSNIKKYQKQHNYCIHWRFREHFFNTVLWKTVNVLPVHILSAFSSGLQKSNPWENITSVPNLHDFKSGFIWDNTKLFKTTVSPYSKYFKTAMSVSDLCLTQVSKPEISSDY